MIRKEKLELIKLFYEELKTKEITRVNNTSFITSEKYKITLNNGKIIYREKIFKSNKDGSASIILPVTKEGEIVTVVEPRVFTKDTVAVGFPSGYIEENEEPLKGAIRELKEETGYVSDKWINIDSYYQDEGCSGAYNYSFIAFNSEKKFEQKLDQDELVRYILLNYDELFELERIGYISGANSKLTLNKSIPYMKGRKI